METPQPQMQGQGQPQEQGQDQQMQQVMQVVQQMVQQGMQPVEIAAQLLQQVPPEAIMQVFVQMGIPQEEAQVAIEEAMQQGQQAQQPQGPGEEQMEGVASNPAEEAEEVQMAYGGRLPRRLAKRAEGGENPDQEMQAVMGQVQEMMQGGADARQVMEQIQAAAQQGQISPEVAQAVMQQLSGQMQAVDPQSPQEGMNPQTVDPAMASPDSQMMAFGGNLKKLMSKAFGGDLMPPSIDSKTYAQDRASMITNAIKNNTFKSTLNSDFPSLMGNQMAYGGDLPKADKGAFNLADYKTADEAELAAYRYKQGLSPEEQAKFDVKETLKGWKQPEPTYEAGKNYQYDPTTKQFKVVDAPAAGVQTAQGVGYPNPLGGGLYNNLYYGASPMARFMANSTMYGVPKVKGSNLPGGMDATAFMMQTAGQNLAPGMAGKANGQDYRVTGVEDIKGGLFGRKKVGVRYNIDWGSPEAMAAAQQQGTPAGPGLAGFNADANGDSIPDYLGLSTTGMNTGVPAAGPQNQTAPSNTQQLITAPSSGIYDPMGSNNIDANAVLAPGMQNSIATSNGSNMMGTSNAPTLENPLAGYVNQSMAPMPIARPGSIRTNQPSGLAGISALNQRQEVADFQAGQAAKGLVWNAPTNSWVSQDALDVSTQMNTAPEPIVAPVEREAPMFASQEDLMNVVNNPAPSYREYGGNVDPMALNNAIQLINKAFGGMMPKAANGMQMPSTIDITSKTKINPDWDAVSDMYMGTGNRLVNIMEGANAMNPERSAARMSALNTQPVEFSQMKQGLYDQAGNFIPNDIGNQVLNPTDVYYNQEKQVFAYGGRVYEMGGDVELDDNELVALQQAGFKIAKA